MSFKEYIGTTIKEYIVITIGCLIFSSAISALLIPNKIGAGGVIGIATSISKLFGLKIGLVSVLINVPLFLFGFQLLGKKFAIKTGYVVVLSSFFIDFLNFKYEFKPFHDVLLASIFCGALIGLGIALIFMAGGSTGGLDISAKMLKNKFPELQLSFILLVEDILVYILVGYVFGLNAILYALVLSFAKTKAMDIIQQGISSTKQCIIICSDAEPIAAAIKTQLLRGATILQAKGSYSNSPKQFIYVVINNNQLRQLKSIVKEIEPTAFTTVSEVTDIVGQYREGKIV